MRVQVYEWLRITQPLTANFTNLLTLPQTKGFIGFSLKYFRGTNIGLALCPNRLYINYTGGFKFVGDDNIQPTIDTNTISIKDSDILINGNLISNISGDKKVNIYAYQNTEADIAISEIKQDNGIFKPCKLLSPYQNHPAGECAMIDVLSNTLYFNQGSGAFSVEGEAGEIIDTTPCYNNIISKESKVAVRLREWISNNGTGAYINTNTPLKQVSTRFLSYNSEDTDAWILYADGSNNVHYWRNYIDMRLNNAQHTFFNASGKVYELKYENGAYSMNGTIFSYSEFSGSSSARIFNFSNTTKSKIGVTTINDHIFHPCELALPFGTHPIGECCMIDLLSGDLYFNQGSGSFSCEGAVLGYWQDKPMNDHYCDVEGTLHRSVQIFADNGERLALIWEKSKPWTEHRWLVINCPNQNNLRITPIRNVKTAKFNVFSPASYWGNNGIALLYNNEFKECSLFRNNSPWQIWSSKKYSAVYNIADFKDREINEIDISIGKITINGKSVDVGDLELQAIGTICGAGESQIHYSEIIADGHTLTPAILNRPTLASEDNNNIARKQGEAVFVDEERYKQGLPWCFGNVASSGSFSVSDYLIENQDFERISGVKSNSRCKINLPCGIVGLSYTIVTLSGIVGHADVISDDNGKFCIINYDANNVAFNHNNGWNGYWQFAKDEKHEYTFKYDGQYINGLSWAPVTRTNSGNASIGGFCVIKSVKYDGVIDLIPVRLLRNIETHTTHNGKGGKANEIGFFDSVSGKFYGNDGQGEFTEYIP